jgi:hypothetical protein
MDLWQLLHLTPFFVLPMRPDEGVGLLISDVDFQKQMLKFATRLGGRDFNKARQSFQVPFPVELATLFNLCRGERSEGPLLRARSAFFAPPSSKVNNITDLAELASVYGQRLVKAGAEVQSENDAKRVFRALLHSFGGVSRDQLAKSYKNLAQQLDTTEKTRFYDLRGAVQTEMKNAGVPMLDLKYMTGRSQREIMFDYVSLDPHKAMAPYFAIIRPLLEAINVRLQALVPSTACPSSACQGQGE